MQKSAPPAGRDVRLEVPERVRFDGGIAVPLDRDAVRSAARHRREAGVAAVAICFLFAHLAPAHEAEARRIAAEQLPDAFTTTSHEVAPE